MAFLHYVIGIGLVLGVMILVHEWGHFVMARLFKVRVDVFSIGFGPRLFGWKRGDTDYRVSALPLGGYVRMAGQDLSELDSTDQAPTGAPDELMSKSRWQRALISFAGPAVNLVFPILLLGGLYIIKGDPYLPFQNQAPQIVSLSLDKDAPKTDLREGDTVRAVNGIPVSTWEDADKALEKVDVTVPVTFDVEAGGVERTVKVPLKSGAGLDLLLGNPPIPPVIDKVEDGYPAARAGLRDGDIVTAIDGQPVKYWGQFVDRVRSSGGKTLDIAVDRKGQTVHASVTPEKNPNEAGDLTYQVGVALKDQTKYRHVPPAEALGQAVSQTKLIIARTAQTVGLLVSGRVSIKQLQGPVGISHMAKQAVDRGPLAVISLMAVISVNLGILNLLPIPILDGGNILLLAVEGIMRRDLSLAFKERFVQVGLVFLLVLFAIVMYHDVLRRLAPHS
ncbi:MAG TPA: RIP metalloprotease RseP [Candidatus Acidoferrum sp.]|nr:RIP metalloprotease RseP [Candidatus Acidoferrum sp.]